MFLQGEKGLARMLKGTRMKRMFGIGSILILFMCGCSEPERVTVPPDISNAIAVIEREKTKAGNGASMIKSKWTSNTEQYNKGAELYTEAQGAFNGWIEQLKFDLVAGTNIETSGQYKESLSDSLKKSDAFHNYVLELQGKTGTKVFGPAGFVYDTITGVSDAAIKVWKEFRTAKKERREELIRLLDSYKWRPFREI